jgi:hypothetical protein
VKCPGFPAGKFDRNDEVLVAKIMMLKSYQTIEIGSHLFLSLYRKRFAPCPAPAEAADGSVAWCNCGENALAFKLESENDVLPGHHDPSRPGHGVGFQN